MLFRRRRETTPISPDERDRRDNEAIAALIASELQPDSCCIDVGAHAGIWLDEFRRAAPHGRHLAYEPLPELYRDLVERFPEMDVRNAALSNVTGETSFVHVLDLPGQSGIRRREYPREVETETITVRTERLDDALPEGFVPALVIVDVEGAEELVVEGALETIRRHKPLVVFEHGVGAAEFYDTTPGDMYRLLCDEARLRLFDLDGAGPFGLREFESRFATAQQWNWLARP